MNVFGVILALVFAMSGSGVVGYNILGLFIHPGKSHFDVYHPLLRALAEKGHNVTVVSFFPDKNPVANYRDLVLDPMEEAFNESIDLTNFENANFLMYLLGFFVLDHWGTKSCENALNSKVVKQIISNREKYDLILLEQFNTDCAVGIAHHFNAPYIALSSCALMPWHFRRIGTPDIPSYISSQIIPGSDKMSFDLRLQNWFVTHSGRILYEVFTNRKTNEQMRRHFGADFPDIGYLTSQTSLMLMNQHFTFSGPKPIPPGLIEIGGMHLKEPKPLSPEFQKIVDSSKDGVIIFSWGSLAKIETINPVRRDALMDAFREIPQTVIFKWPNETIPKQPKNVILKRWLPQRDLLCHPKVVVFFTHGGLLGSTEAVDCGTPVIATPLFGDQPLNSAALVRREVGVMLRYWEITKESVLEALRTVLSPEMKQKSKNLAIAFKNRPAKPLETAIWWSEYVVETKGARLLRSHSIDMPWYAYHLLDVYAVVLVVIFVILGVFYAILRCCCCRGKGKGEKVKRQ